MNKNNQQARKHIKQALKLIEALRANKPIKSEESMLVLPAFLQSQAG